MAFQWRNSKGFGTISFSIVVAAITLGYFYYQHGTLLEQQKLSAKSVADIRMKVIEEKLSKMSAFLIASNFIACKQSAWENGNPKKTCQWNNINYNGDSIAYEPKSFNLVSQGLDDKKKLTFNVDIKSLFKGDTSGQFLTGSNTWLKFSLVHKDSFTSNFGKVITSSTDSNQDNFLILLEGNIEYYTTGGKVTADSFATAIRRPVAIPKVKVLASSCAQRCDVSVGESPNPACRSSFYIDKDTVTSLQASTTNLGPGLIYDLQYRRTTAYNTGASLVKSAEQATSVNVGITDYILPGGNKNWADTFPCATFSETVNKSQRVVLKENNKMIDGLISLNWNSFSLLGQLIIPEANAGFVEVTTGSSSTTTLSQHANPAGAVVYQLSPGETDAASSMEPYRMTSSVAINSGDQSFQGLMDTTVNTTFYKIIWVNPPH